MKRRRLYVGVTILTSGSILSLLYGCGFRQVCNREIYLGIADPAGHPGAVATAAAGIGAPCAGAT